MIFSWIVIGVGLGGGYGLTAAGISLAPVLLHPLAVPVYLALGAAGLYYLSVYRRYEQKLPPFAGPAVLDVLPDEEFLRCGLQGGGDSGKGPKPAGGGQGAGTSSKGLCLSQCTVLRPAPASAAQTGLLPSSGYRSAICRGGGAGGAGTGYSPEDRRRSDPDSACLCLYHVLHDRGG